MLWRAIVLAMSIFNFLIFFNFFQSQVTSTYAYDTKMRAQLFGVMASFYSGIFYFSVLFVGSWTPCVFRYFFVYSWFLAFFYSGNVSVHELVCMYACVCRMASSGLDRRSI